MARGPESSINSGAKALLSAPKRRARLISMSEENPSQPVKITPLPSLLEFGRMVKNEAPVNEAEALFYTCPQCGHAMVTKKCKIVCYQCHYFIGCVE